VRSDGFQAEDYIERFAGRQPEAMHGLAILPRVRHTMVFWGPGHDTDEESSRHGVGADHSLVAWMAPIPALGDLASYA
jgi:hypothetical protein